MASARAEGPFPIWVRELRAVAAARLTGDGRLIEWNAGFASILPARIPAAGGSDVRDAFIQPDFASLAAAADYAGLMTVGDRDARSWTLKGGFSREGDGWRIVAEHDVEEWTRQSASLFELNADLARTHRELTQANRRLDGQAELLRRLSLTDALTGLGNRRRLEEGLTAEIARARREHGRLAVMMCDLDHFKRVNDRYGHDAGDRVLAGFARLIKGHFRTSDLAARFGGEEFMVLMPGAGAKDAADASDRLRRMLEQEKIEPLPDPVTGSFGIAELSPDDTPETLVKRVDGALYAAKTGGRNRVVIAGEETAGRPG